jgi:transposase
VAVRHGLHRNQIFAWRRQFRNRAALIGHPMPEFVPVRLASPTGSSLAVGSESGKIEVMAGGITIRLGTGFDDGDLRRVLQIVRELA